MTITVWVGFNRKPNKSPGAAVARAFGMKERQTNEFEWCFQKKQFRVMLEDLREQMKPEFREWADDVGWPYNYALQVAVHDKRDSLDYIKWVSLITVLMEAYEQTVLWFDYGTDAPVTRHKLVDFAEFKTEMKEGEPEVSSRAPVDEPEEVQEEEDFFAESPSQENEDIDMEKLPAGLLDMIRNQMTRESPKVAEEPKLVPLATTQEEEDFDDFEDWDDDEDFDEDDDDDVGGQAVTWD